MVTGAERHYRAINTASNAWLGPPCPVNHCRDNGGNCKINFSAFEYHKSKKNGQEKLRFWEQSQKHMLGHFLLVGSGRLTGFLHQTFHPLTKPGPPPVTPFFD
eukprot:2710265-Amphidinium_carterae.1